jgi:hypothetical protein
MLSEPISRESISSYRKGLFPEGCSIFILPARNQSVSSSIDSYAPCRISTIIAASLVTYSSRVEQGFKSMTVENILQKSPFRVHGYAFDYIFNPSILEWQCKQLDTSLPENSIEILLDIHSAVSGEMLESLRISNKSSGNNEIMGHTCELLIDPLGKIIPELFRIPQPFAAC